MQNGTVFYRTGVMADLRIHCGNRDFRPFCSCDLDLYPMTFINELDPYTLKIYRMCKYELLIEAFESYRLTSTDRQTQPKLSTTPLRGFSVKQLFKVLSLSANARP